jgi:hypothetical protein
MNTQINDVADYFDRLYKDCDEEVSVELRRNISNKKPAKLLLKIITYHPVISMIVCFIVFTIMVFIIFKCLPILPATIFMCISEFLLIGSIVTIIIYSARATSSDITMTRQWELRAARVLSKHNEKYKETKELLRGLEISTHFRQALFRYMSGICGTLVIFCTLSANTLDYMPKVMTYLLSSLSMPSRFHPLMFVTIFFVLVGIFFVTVYVPLEWYRHLRLFLERQIALTNEEQ